MEDSDYYYGMTAQKFNERLRSHRKSFNNANYRGESKLSEYIWDLKEKGITNYVIKWNLIKKTRCYQPGMWYCPLCNLEKYYILKVDKRKMINKRSELMNKCLHKGKYLLDKISTASKEVGKKDNTVKILGSNGIELKKSGAPSLNKIKSHNTLQR